MSTRNVQLTFQAGTPTGNQTQTASFTVSVANPDGSPFYGPTSLPVTSPPPNTLVLAMPIANAYIVMVSAVDAAGTNNAHPPSITFSVTPPPPPPVPPDPILNQPMLL